MTNHFDWNKLSYGEFTAFVRAVMTRDIDGYAPLLQKVIGWGDEAFNELDLESLVALAGEAVRSTDDVIKGFSLDDISVDLSKWKRSDWAAYRTSRNAGDTDTAEKLLKQVVRFPYELALKYSFKEGVTAIRAVDEAYNKALSGKN